MSAPPPEPAAARVVLVDPVRSTREALAVRLAALGYIVEVALDGASGADLALATSPDAVICDLWMPGVSGVQLCRLLRSEPATADVPVVLRGADDDRRDRFWAERAGAAAYVTKGRMGELVRELRKAVERAPRGGSFFMQFSETMDIRDRIARHLDAALFESVIAGEVRALASCDSVQRLFDLFSQFFAQVHRYRWLALATDESRVSIHLHPACSEVARAEVLTTFDLADAEVTIVQDEDAVADAMSADPITRPVWSGDRRIGTIAISPIEGSEEDAEKLLRLVAAEIGGPLRTAMLVEEIRRLACTDALTSLLNRRAFGEAVAGELARAERLGQATSFAILDIDHFKKINDRLGHATGDRVICEVAATIRRQVRAGDHVCRWGGEEFVIAFTNTRLEDALIASERARAAVAAASILDDAGEPVTVSASFGVAERSSKEPMQTALERADRALYEAKTAGRDRVVAAPAPISARTPALPSSVDTPASDWMTGAA